MPSPKVVADLRGIRLDASIDEACDVYFDGAHVWSFAPAERRPEPDGARLIPWPPVMRNWLDGVAEVRVAAQEETLFAGELRFGDSTERIRFVDRRGIPVMVDKWGLLQRPFSGRGHDVVESMVDTAERILEVLERECGVRAWIAFGTLLGAARSGKVIGHDSDIDLAYLSRHTTPYAVALEMFQIARVLRRNGLRVMNKSASFITVLATAPDGGQTSIDLYSCFYVGDLLHETATVRAPVPRAAIEPLGRMEFEGRMLPVPAQPDVVLRASYGDGWRVPDPSFTHRPGPEIKQRFDGWFGSLMRHRRDWESYYRRRRTEPVPGPSGFARWVRRQLEPGVTVLDVGCGSGRDTLWFAKRGWPAVGMDYARNAPVRARRAAVEGATFSLFNLADFRDVVTCAALVARTSERRVLYARGVVDALEPDALANFWRFADLVLRGHGRAYLEFGGSYPEPGDGAGGRRFRTSPAAVEQMVDRAGGRVLELHRAPRRGPDLWRMAVEWTR